nr:hypothetical protein [Actinomycetota bacterium]
VIHRIVGGSAAAGYQLRGDNRSGDDIWRPRSSLIVGELWLHVPRVGNALLLLREPLWLGVIVALLVFVSVITARPKRPAEPPVD